MTRADLLTNATQRPRYLISQSVRLQATKCRLVVIRESVSEYRMATLAMRSINHFGQRRVHKLEAGSLH
jgi:hypothetical protein